MGLTVDQLREIVESQDFRQLVGAIENEHFDCKSQPYRLEEGEKQKRELAKDVSAFANADGGYIFIGLRTEKSMTHLADEVVEVRPFLQSLVARNQYEQVVAEWVYPPVEDLSIEWLKTTKDDKGIAVITVPPQEERTKPFLIKKTLDGGKIVETVFGYAQRRSDATDIRSVIDLQRALRAGFSYHREVAVRLANIESLVERLFSDRTEAAETGALEARVGGRIADAIKQNDMREQRLMVLAAYPPTPGELRTVFSSDQGSIRRCLANPPIFRQAGWSLETPDYHADIVRGDFIRVASYSKAIHLHRDGTMIFGALATDAHLAWGRNALQLTPIALIETIASFTQFYGLVLDDFHERPTRVIFRVELHHMHLNEQSTSLPPGPSGDPWFLTGQLREAPDDQWETTISFDTEDYDPAVVAAGITREVYLWFGHEESVIPYMTDKDGVRRVAVEQFKS